MPDSVQAAPTSGQQDLQSEIARLNKIIQALMNRAERSASLQGSDFNLFQTAITLEDQVRSRTGELEVASLERERIARDLRESENHYRLLVENSPVSIHEIDRNGRITSMSQAGLRMRGVNNESEVQGTLYLEVVCTDDRERIKELFDKACAGETSHFEFKVSGSNGQIYKSCFVPIKNKNGSIEKLMGITEDITERKRAQEEIELKNRILLHRTGGFPRCHSGGQRKRKDHLLQSTVHRSLEDTRRFGECTTGWPRTPCSCRASPESGIVRRACQSLVSAS